MPKEMVLPPLEDNEVYVQWGADSGYVQVGSCMREELRLREFARDILDGKYDGAPFGIYATMSDRRSVNDLIRKLRRARDQAFGADA